MFAVHFNERVWPGLPPGQRFTTDRTELRAALMRSTARGQTALFDAILTGLKHLEAGQRQKKVLIVISDGGDNASRSQFDDVLDAALRMNVLIYSIGIYDQYDRDAKPKLLRKLAESTGAESFFPERADEVGPILQRIAQDIRSGYTIGYVPAAGPGRPGHRAVRVVVRPSDGRKLAARARSGYAR
jgi:VWFA-related protein